MSDSTRTFKVEKNFRWQGEITKKVAAVMRMFGLDTERLRNNPAGHSCEIQLRQGDVCYITGPSGAGKSVLLRELYNSLDESERINLGEIELAEDKSLVDCIGADFLQALKLLSWAGLSDVFCILNQPARLSDGQKYRFRLAKALECGSLSRASRPNGKIVFADEFCSSLDRVTAAVIAYNVHKFAKRNKVTFILAGSHDDILGDLSPDVLVVKHLTGKAEVIYKDRQRQQGDNNSCESAV